MALSKWFCTNNSRNMLVKIVHPGGRIELHDRPMLAAEVMLRHPRCCVTHPHVFRDPSAILAPDGVLMLGQKYYVVPISSIRKLQRHHLRHSPSSSPSPLRRLQSSKNIRSPMQLVHSSKTTKHNGLSTPHKVGAGDEMESESMCWIFANMGTPKSHTSATTSTKEIKKQQQSLSEDCCFNRLLRIAKTKVGGDWSSESKKSNKKMVSGNEKLGIQGSPKLPLDVLGCDHWEPNLERISEEQP